MGTSLTPGAAAWKRARFERAQTITKEDGAFIRDCMETRTRYYVVDHKVVLQMSEADIEWQKCWHPYLPAFGTMLD